MAEDSPISERIPNRKHRLFIDELFKQNQNATRAYLTVYGCEYDTARINGSKLLTNANISEEIERRLKQNQLSADEVIARLSEQARAEYTDYIDKSGYVDIKRMKADGKAHLIQGTKWDKDGRLVVKFPDSQSALVHVGKVHGLFSENITVKLEQELSKTLDYLQDVLDTETYQNVISAIAAHSEAGETETEATTAE